MTYLCFYDHATRPTCTRPPPGTKRAPLPRTQQAETRRPRRPMDAEKDFSTGSERDHRSDVLAEVAKALNVSTEEIKSYSEEMTYYNIQNNYDTASQNNIGPAYHECTFNPLDKLLESIENERQLYNALLKEKEEKIALLERMLDASK